MQPHTHLPYTPSEFLCVDILWTPVSPKDTTMSPPQSNCWPTRFLLQCFRLLTMVPVVWQFNSCSITQRKRRWLLWRWYEVPLRLPPQRTRFTLGIHCMVLVLIFESNSLRCFHFGSLLHFWNRFGLFRGKLRSPPQGGVQQLYVPIVCTLQLSEVVLQGMNRDVRRWTLSTEVFDIICTSNRTVGIKHTGHSLRLGPFV